MDKSIVDRSTLLCIRDVILEDGQRAFTKGISYTIYTDNHQVAGEDIGKQLIAIDDQECCHVILNPYREDMTFFDEHFKIVPLPSVLYSTAKGLNEICQAMLDVCIDPKNWRRRKYGR